MREVFAVDTEKLVSKKLLERVKEIIVEDLKKIETEASDEEIGKKAAERASRSKPLEAVEMVLKKDDMLSRQSIYLKTPKSLDIKEKESIYFIIIDGTDTAIELVCEFLDKCKIGKDVLKKFDEQESEATEGLGAILG